MGSLLCDTIYFTFTHHHRIMLAKSSITISHINNELKQ